jgi:hypothetical protein
MKFSFFIKKNFSSVFLLLKNCIILVFKEKREKFFQRFVILFNAFKGPILSLSFSLLRAAVTADATC